ncbi:MAG: hypothetical protein IKP67_00150 [Spirochaetales bacterium]|nr:hypothetical protein [Spirochaetales bacterium]
MEQKKSIGNEQSFPIELLNDAILEWLSNGNIDRDNLLCRVQQFNKGKNRSRKAMNSIYTIVMNSTVIHKKIKTKCSLDFLRGLNGKERNLLSIALYCIRFPFMYDLLFCLGKLFSLQDSVNKQYIVQSLSAIYGSNRSLIHGIDACMNILIDADMIQRIQPGLFIKQQSTEIGEFIIDVWIEMWQELNGKKIIDKSELLYEPIMSFLE